MFLHVVQGDDTPYYYIGDGMLETYVRIGNESVVADATEHKRLVLRGRNSSFDARPSDESIDDYAFTKLRSRYYAWNGTSFDNKLFRSFGLVDNKGILTNAGLLIADECPIRQSRVFCTRWNGKNKASGTIDALDNIEITGGLVTLLEDTMAFIRRNTKTMWYKEPMQRVEIPEYVERCVMEVVVNALAHRDYLIQGSEIHVDMFDDRMVIYSPGAMPEGRIVQDMVLSEIPSVRRNPVIADVFAHLGFMERKGSGMGKIIDPIKALPYYTDTIMPIFFSDRAQFTVTFPNIIKIINNNDTNNETDDTNNNTNNDTNNDTNNELQGNLDKWIKAKIIENPQISTMELAKLSGKSVSTIKRHIAKMTNIQYVGNRRNGHWEIIS